MSVMCPYYVHLTCMGKNDCNVSCFSCEGVVLVIGMMRDLHKNEDFVLINTATDEYPQ